MLYLLVFIASMIAFKVVSKVLDRKPKQIPITDLPDGIITPVEALTLSDSQRSELQGYLNWINDHLKSRINGYVKSCTISFENKINDKFPMESVYEIKRLYEKAGWKVSLYRKVERNSPYRADRSWWEMEFKVPYGTEIPSQLTKIRVQPENEPSLEDLGIDTLEQKFKELEKKK